MNVYQEKENSDKYHWLLYKWTLELSPKPPNYRNMIDVFKGIWKFTRISKIQEKIHFLLLLFLKPVTVITRFLHSTQCWVLEQNSHWRCIFLFSGYLKIRGPCAVFPRHSLLSITNMSPGKSFFLVLHLNLMQILLMFGVVHGSVALLCLAFDLGLAGVFSHP